MIPTYKGAIVSCGGANPSITATEEFLANPSDKELKVLTEGFSSLSQDEAWEYQQWHLKHQHEMTEASSKVSAL